MIRNLTTIHKTLRKNNYVQAVSFGNYIFEAKGILVMLKIISEKLLQTEVQLELDTFSLDSPSPVIKPPGPVEGVVQDILYLFFYIAYDYPEVVVNFLNEYKAQYAIKKYPKLFPQNEQIKRLTYLLLKKQMDLLPKKIKANPANMAIVSHNYSAYIEKPAKENMSSSQSISISVNTSSHSAFSLLSKSNTLQHMNATLMKGYLEDLLVSKPLELNQENIKKLCEAMNSVYTKQKDDFGRVWAEKYQGKKAQENKTGLYNRLYRQVEVEQNFEKFYESWLETEVFGVFD